MRSPCLSARHSVAKERWRVPICSVQTSGPGKLNISVATNLLFTYAGANLCACDSLHERNGLTKTLPNARDDVNHSKGLKQGARHQNLGNTHMAEFQGLPSEESNNDRYRTVRWKPVLQFFRVDRALFCRQDHLKSF